MDIKQLRKDLKSNPRTINIFGTESVFRKEAIEEITKHFVKIGTEDFNVSFISNESDKEIGKLIQEAPFDSNYKLVFLNNGAKYIRYITDTSILVALDNSFEKPHLSINCSKIYGRQLRALIKSRAKLYGLEMDKQDIDLFVSLNGNNLALIDNELTKISLIEEFSNKVLQELSSMSSQSKLEELMHGIAEKNLKMMLTAFYTLTDFGSTESQLFGFIVFYIKKIIDVFQFKEEDDIEDFDLKKAFKIKSLFEFDFLVKTISVLFEIDTDVKEGKFPFIIFLICMTKRDFSATEAFINKMHN